MPQCFVGSFTANGSEQFANVQGMINSDKCPVILQTYLLPTMRKDIPDTEDIFQQDVSPCHTSRQMHTFFEESELKV